MTTPTEHKLRWYQYKLSSLFILTILVCLASSWYANEMFKATERRKAIAEIVKLEGMVWYYDASDPYAVGEPPAWYSWLRKLHGDEYLGYPVYITFHGGDNITDAELVHLKGLTKLEGLALIDTQITDDGLVHLKDLTNLEGLYLDDPQITDAGLEHLKGLTTLRELNLYNTQVTDEGVKNLQEALPNCKIEH